MGDPRRIRNQYKTPNHPWQRGRLEQEKPLMKKYGLTTKKELWTIDSKLTGYKDNAKKLVARSGAQAEKEKSQLFAKLKKYALVNEDSFDQILGLSIEQLLDKRLQTVVYRKGLARTIKQARQMITHGHIMVGGKKLTAPSYLVTVAEEESVAFLSASGFNDEEHPERVVPQTNAEKTEKSEVSEKKLKERKHKKSERKKSSKKKIMPKAEPKKESEAEKNPAVEAQNVEAQKGEVEAK